MKKAIAFLMLGIMLGSLLGIAVTNWFKTEGSQKRLLYLQEQLLVQSTMKVLTCSNHYIM